MEEKLVIEPDASKEYHNESNGEWNVIHLTQSLICPIDMDFG